MLIIFIFCLTAFHKLSLLYFPLLHFPPLLSTPEFSTPAFSTPAFSAPPPVEHISDGQLIEFSRRRHSSSSSSSHVCHNHVSTHITLTLHSSHCQSPSQTSVVYSCCCCFTFVYCTWLSHSHTWYTSRVLSCSFLFSIFNVY